MSILKSCLFSPQRLAWVGDGKEESVSCAAWAPRRESPHEKDDFGATLGGCKKGGGCPLEGRKERAKEGRPGRREVKALGYPELQEVADLSTMFDSVEPPHATKGSQKGSQRL